MATCQENFTHLVKQRAAEGQHLPYAHAEVDPIMDPISQMGKLRPRELKPPAPGHGSGEAEQDFQPPLPGLSPVTQEEWCLMPA